MRIASLVISLAVGLAPLGLAADTMAPEPAPALTAAPAPAAVSSGAQAQADLRNAEIARLQAQTQALQAQTQALQAQNQPAQAAVPAPAAAPTVAPTPLAIPATVTLKDGQKAALTVTGYDRFFLTGENAKGTRFDLPWTQVAAVDGAGGEGGSDLAVMRGNITGDPAAVDSTIEPRYGRVAFDKALWPGLILHGSGFRYAGDNETFVDLAGAEIFGVVVGAFGLYLEAAPNTSDTTKLVPQVLTIAGGAIFVATWLWDLAFSPGAALALDQAKGLALAPRPDGLQLSYRF